MKPPIEPTPEQVTSDAQGKVLDMAAEQDNIEGVYAPPPVPQAPAQQMNYHDIMLGYGPPPALMQAGMSGLFARNLSAERDAFAFGQQSKPEDTEVWVCACGAANTGRFCSDCGRKHP